jgi:2-methylisocitrate lyase-like PEP mutase family enzyme
MHEATRSIPIIGDGDTGYGNAMNVKRTVSQYAAAGFAGILIEDQEWPKSCGHVRGKRVISQKESIARIKAACDARDELDSPEKIIIVARTDARQAVSFQEAMARAAAFADVGADVVFVDALESEAEMRTLCAEVPSAFKMANMLEGGGKTPILSPDELEHMGFKLCAYPLSLLGVSINAMRSALHGLKQGKVPVAPQMPTFEELQAAVGFPTYFEEEAKYAVTKINSSSGTATSSTSNDNKSSSTTARGEGGTSSFTGEHQQGEEQQQQSTCMAIEADEVIEPGSSPKSSRSAHAHASSSSSQSSSTKAGDGTFDVSDPSIDRRSQWLRIKIVNLKTGIVDLDTRFPAGFLGPVATIVPQVAGLDLEALVWGENKGSENKAPRPGEPVFRFETDGERIEIYFEN